jgi:hypothetical protein
MEGGWGGADGGRARPRDGEVARFGGRDWGRLGRGACRGEFFLFIALFLSIFESSINLELIVDLGHRYVRRMRLVEIVSGGYD